MTKLSRGDTFNFIDYYQNEPRLWDPGNQFYGNENKANESWKTISASMKIPVVELKKEKDELMKLYLLHKDSVHSSVKSGDKVDKPSWPYYAAIDAFLGAIYQSGCSDQKKGPVFVNLTENELDDTTAEGPQKENPSPAVVTRTPQPKPRCSPAPKRHSITSIQSDDTCEMDIAGTSSGISIGNEECDDYVKLFGAKLKRFPKEQSIELMEDIEEFIMKKRRLMPSDSSI